MKFILKNAREKKGLKTREVAQILGIDQALISKFENGLRIPTREQILKLSSLLEIDLETIMVSWFKEKILNEIGFEPFAIQAMHLVCAENEQNIGLNSKISISLLNLLNQIDVLKNKLRPFKSSEKNNILQTLEIEYTFESNRIEGNTLTLRETDLVLNQGLTIPGKSMREHLEVINHKEAISYIKQLIANNIGLNENEVLSIHNLILRGIPSDNAGKYRKDQDNINETSLIPDPSFMVSKEMENLFTWFEIHKNKLHPIILAAEMHKKLFNIQPFTEGNGRTSRLIMNFILLQHGYLIANIKGDHESKTEYFNTLEKARTKNNNEDFALFIANTEKLSFERYFKAIGEKIM